MLSPPDDEALVELLTDLALAAGRSIMAVRERGFLIEAKADASPVTAADRCAEAVILDGLRARFPGCAIVAEEEVAAGRCPAEPGETFFLVDALDGTREFVGGGDDFTVNIALVRRGVPEAGVVYAPALNRLYTGRPGHAAAAPSSPGHEAGEMQPIAIAEAGMRARIVASRSHRSPETDAFIARFEGAGIVSVGSSLKFCLLAEGKADIYPRHSRTMEWDTAAGDAILRAAGGVTATLDGTPLAYGKRRPVGDTAFANPSFVALGDVRPDWPAILPVRDAMADWRRPAKR